MRYLPLLSASILVCSSFSLSVFAAEESLSDAQIGAISQHCESFRQTFHSIQIADSNTRSHFGRLYESIITSYIKPLNKRLVDASISSPELISLQSDIITSRTAFSSDFITYSQSLEELMNIDCAAHPSDFYRSLVNTRKLRSKVSSDVSDIEKSLTKFRAEVAKIKDTL